MTLHRQSFIAFLLLTAVVSLFFSPLLQAHGGSARHHLVRTNAAVTSAFTYSPSIATSSFSSTAPEQRALRAEGLIELHCTRLC
jgi:hypothetical protein